MKKHKFMGSIKKGYSYDLTALFGVGKEPKRFIDWRLRREIRRFHREGYDFGRFEQVGNLKRNGNFEAGLKDKEWNGKE